MKPGRHQILVQLLGMLSVAASLLFVGYEIKQSRDIAIADVYQQRAALMLQIQTSSYSTEAYESAWKRQQAGESLSDADKSLIVYVESSPWMTYYENNHFQYELGLLSAEQWEASKRAITVLAEKPGVLEWWGSKRVDFTVSFAEEVDEIFAQQGTTN